MTLSKVVRKGSYQGVSQWGIDTSSEITPSRATARKWAELENARHPMNQLAKCFASESEHAFCPFCRSTNPLDSDGYLIPHTDRDGAPCVNARSEVSQ